MNERNLSTCARMLEVDDARVAYMNFYRLSGGKFVEERGQPDLLSLLQQIGAVQAA